jgi:NAD(P)-dependent dehydrogenase (short-subunit alcohol dehydrogenase family)
MIGKTVVVTGANTGIGLETARELARRGARVIMTARNRDKGEAAVHDVQRTPCPGGVELVVFDLGSLRSVQGGAEEILRRAERIDVLVNNAGLVLGERQLTPDGFEATFGINHLGPFLLTNLLLDRLRASAPSRVVNVSSRAHKRALGIWFDDLTVERRPYVGFLVYAHSKLANVLFSRELARRLEGTRVTSNALHPGVVATGFAQDGDLGGLQGLWMRMVRPFMLSPAEGAQTTIWCATEPGLAETSGRYFSECREAATSRAGADADAARRLWDVSRELVGLS